MKRAKKVNRSRAGSIFTALFLLLIGAFMVLPMIYAVSNALKPTDELFRFPPKLFPDNPTTQNFKDLFILMNTSWVPFTRYFFNTLFIRSERVEKAHSAGSEIFLKQIILR